MRVKKALIGMGLVAAVVAVSVLTGIRFGKQAVPQTAEQASGEYPLLSRRIFLEDPKEPLINFVPLRQDFQQYFTDNGLSGSLYFEYLHTGVEVRISEDEKQAAASLLKVPLAMELYKAAELGKIDLDQRVTLTNDMLDSAFGTLYQKGVGHSLTLAEAARIMLVDSDNTALKAVAAYMEGVLPPQESVFNYLDASITQAPDLSVSIGSRAYSSILKCLYYSCYLNHDDSELLLEHLTQTKFDDRMMAGISDKNIKVAHKIGVFQEITQSDCGIVYLPHRPYIFCAMIDGPNTDEVDNHLAELSRKAYLYVQDQ